MDETQLPEIEIFRAGTHTAVDGTVVTVTDADLDAIAQAYDPAAGEAPLVVGHPDIAAPAYGWAKSLATRDGVLFAAADQVDPAFKGLVQAGRFKKRSASFFLPNSPGNPKPGAMYLRHIGFLGAAAPAVAGLRDVRFAASAAFVEINSTPNLETAMSEKTIVDFAARETAVSAREQKIAEREAAIAATERATTRKGVVEFSASLVQAGRLLPRDQPQVVELLDTLSQAKPTELSFAAPDGALVKKPAAQVLRDLLAAMPVQTPMGELGASPGDAPTSADFAAPAGVAVDSARLALHNKALAYQRQHAGTEYLAAVRAVGG